MALKQMRKKQRFEADPNTLAVLCFENELYVGLVINESHGGCRVAFLSSIPLGKGSVGEISVGKLAPLKAEIVWRAEAGASLCEMGFNYRE